MVSLVARGGLLDLWRRECDFSTWFSDGVGVGDLEAGVAVAERAAYYKKNIHISTRTTSTSFWATSPFPTYAVLI